MSFTKTNVKRNRLFVSREDQRLVACPKCKVEVNVKCVGTNGVPRLAAHIERVKLFKRTGAT